MEVKGNEKVSFLASFKGGNEDGESGLLKRSFRVPFSELPQMITLQALQADKPVYSVTYSVEGAGVEVLLGLAKRGGVTQDGEAGYTIEFISSVWDMEQSTEDFTGEVNLNITLEVANGAAMREIKRKRRKRKGE